MAITYMKNQQNHSKKVKKSSQRKRKSGVKNSLGLDKKFVESLFNEMLQVPETPVDFQLPDWQSRQNHTDFTYIKRNIYLKKLKRRNEDDGIFCSCNDSPGSPVCGKDCQCGMLLSCCSLNCRCGSSCNNKPFQQRPVKKMKIVKTEKCGLGLIPEEDIRQGEFVTEYVGEVIDDKTCEERLWNMKLRGETNFYLCEVNRDMVIDATYKANKSRFMNHSCLPNTEMQKWRVGGETRIGIFAVRDIKKGEPLTYDYQFIQFGKDQECYCGAPGCRGKLAAKPSKQKLFSEAAAALVAREIAGISPLFEAFLAGTDANDCTSGGTSDGAFGEEFPVDSGAGAPSCIGLHVQIWWPADQRFYNGRLANFNPKTKKHTIIYDDGDIELLDMSKEKYNFVTRTIPKKLIPSKIATNSQL